MDQLLKAGPIVGHTDDRSSTIWISVRDDPSTYSLRVSGVGISQFHSTEEGEREFGTAIAQIDGLRSEWLYRYQIVRRGRAIGGANGTFRTMPSNKSLANIHFVFISCNGNETDGAWSKLGEFIRQSKPYFLLMIGDQVYLDQNGESLWKSHIEKPSRERRQALAERYYANWSRPHLRNVLANIPTYMLWDDHEIRNGWGSLAPDSPTMLSKYPKGKSIYEQHDRYFLDARDLYWHFQLSHNLQVSKPNTSERKAMPFTFRCGHLLVLMLDSRGERDLWRDEYPVLGEKQWDYFETLVKDLDPEIDTLIIITPSPIASMSPKSLAQKLVGNLRQDDIEYFKNGNERGLKSLVTDELYYDDLIDPFKVNRNIKSIITDVRDQWSYSLCQGEQKKLIHKALDAQTTKRIAKIPRKVLFVGGDIHLGGIYDLKIDNTHIPLLISSGIAKKIPPYKAGLVLDENFKVSESITSKQLSIVPDYNFGVVQSIKTGVTPIVSYGIVPLKGGFSPGSWALLGQTGS